MKTINSKTRPYEEPSAFLVNIRVSTILSTSVENASLVDVEYIDYGEI